MSQSALELRVPVRHGDGLHVLHSQHTPSFQLAVMSMAITDMPTCSSLIRCNRL